MLSPREFQMTISVILSVALLFILPASVHSTDWNYDDESPEGPSNWTEHYPTCGGIYTRQSPINIVTTSVVAQTAFTSLSYSNYDVKPSTFTMTNNGHSVQITVPAGQNTYVTGAGLTDRYILEQFHFHWGANDSQGSEHLVDGRSHPLEIHLVHYNSKYPNVAAASADTANQAGVGVLAIFVDVRLKFYLFKLGVIINWSYSAIKSAIG